MQLFGLIYPRLLSLHNIIIDPEELSHLSYCDIYIKVPSTQVNRKDTSYVSITRMTTIALCYIPAELYDWWARLMCSWS